MKTSIKRLTSVIVCLVLIITTTNINVYANSLTSVKSVAASNTTGGIKIKWKKVKGATGYRIYKKKGNKWVKVKDTDKLSYVDKKVKSRKTYKYQIKAYKGKSKRLGKTSKTVSQKYFKAPTLDQFTESGELYVCYNEVKGAKICYIYRANKKRGPYKLVAKRVDEAYYEDKDIITGNCYYYKFRCSDGKVKSGYSKAYKFQTSYQSGDCAMSNHKIKAIKSVKATPLIPGYIVYSCKCGRERYCKITSKATGVKMPSGNDYAYAESVKRNQKSLEYLEMIRKKDKTNLLQVRTGTEEEIRYLKKRSDVIFKNCKTDAQKIKKAYDWIVKNIDTGDHPSSFPIDVYRLREADCEGMANLAVDLLRLQGIPCASIVGYRCDTKHTCTENNIDSMNGRVKHQWVRAYDGKRWVFFDCMWKTYDPDPKVFDIPEWYYTQFTDFAGVYYEGMNLRNQLGFPFYVSGHYYGFETDGKLNTLSSGCFLDDQNYYYQINDNDLGPNGSRSNYYNADSYRLFEVFTNRALYSRDDPGTNYATDKKPIAICYYNGICVVDTCFTLNGKHYADSLGMTYTNYSGNCLCSYEGDIILQKGETIQLHDEYAETEDLKPIFSSENPSIISVTKNGRVKALSKGGTYINVTDKNHFHDGGIYIYVTDDTTFTLKSSDLAPAKDIKVQRSKIRIKL